MNLKEAKEICPRFNPVKKEDGSYKCRNVIEGGMCRRPEYFRCEVKMAMDRIYVSQTAIHPVLSASKIGIGERCPRLFQLIYKYRIESPIDLPWMRQGRAFSNARAAIDIGKPWDLPPELNPVERAKIGAVLKRYAEWEEREKLVCEIMVDFVYKGVRFIGYIDAMRPDKTIIREWKYAAATYDELKVLRQAAIYLHGVPECQTFDVAVATKPKHKPKKAPAKTKKNPDPQPETIKEFHERVYNEYKRDSIHHTLFERGHFNIPVILDQTLASFRIIQQMEELGFPPSYGMECDNCQFRRFCVTHVHSDIGCNTKFCSHPDICRKIVRKRLEKGEKTPVLEKTDKDLLLESGK